MRFFSPTNSTSFSSSLAIIIMSPPSESTSSRAASASSFTPSAFGRLHGPVHRVAFLHPRQLQHRAVLAQGLANALVALLVRHVHAAHIGGNADVVGDKHQHRVGIRIGEVLLDGRELFVVLAASVEVLHAANEEDLEGRHQRRRACAVENLAQVHLRQIHVVEAELANVLRHEVLQDGFPAFPAEERFIADKDVSRRQLARLHVGHEAVRRREAAHQ